jgi:hypothetical protein
MPNELSEERRRLIYRYMQDAGGAPAARSVPAQRTLPRPLPEEVMLASEKAREQESQPVFAPRLVAPLWEQCLMHLRYRYAREGGAAAVVVFALAIGWLVAHAG